ncbi:MAG: arylesterase [Ginsengibacter sp.]
MKAKFAFAGFFLLIAILSCHNGNSKPDVAKQQPGKGNTADTSAKVKTILFFGNSLTAGYGIEPSEAFPALVQNKIDSLKLHYKVINAGVSGETSAGGKSRIGWILRQPVDIFILELGGNDGLRGIPLSGTKKNLQAIIDSVRAIYPSATLVLAGMQIPPNLGQEYTETFKNIYPELAAKNNIALVPFLLQGVGGDPKLNQPDGIHPTAEGAKIVAENVWKVLKNFCE